MAETSMAWTQAYIQYALIYFLSIVFLYLIGRFACFMVGYSFSFRKSFTDIFICLFVGILLIAVLFSFFATRFKTVHILYFLVVPILLQALRGGSRVKESLTATKPVFLELFLYALVLYGFFAAGILRRADWSSFIRIPHMIDWGLYSIDMLALVQTGEENSYHVLSMMSQDYRGLTPYHYPILWLGGLLSSLLPKFSAFYLFSMVVYPLTGFLALVGSWAFIEHLAPIRWYHRLLALVCFFTSGVPLDVFAKFFLTTQGEFLSTTFKDLDIFLFLSPKRFLAHSAFLISCLLLLKRMPYAALLSLLLLPLVSIDTLPAVFGAVSIFGIVAYRNKFMSPGEIRRLALFYFLFGILLVLLYQQLGNDKILLYNPGEALRQSMSSVSGIMIPVLFFFRGLVMVSLLYCIPLVLVFWSLKKQNPDASPLKVIFLIAALMTLSGLVGWAVFFPYIDAIQFGNGILTILQTILLLYLLSQFKNFPLSVRTLYILYLCGSLLFHFSRHYWAPSFKAALPYSKEYLDQIGAIRTRSKIGFSIRSEADFEKSWARRHIVTHSLGDDYLIFMPHLLKAVELSAYEVPDTSFRARPKRIPLINMEIDFEQTDKYRSKVMKESGIFFRFYEAEKRANPKLPMEEALVRFIEAFDLDWGIVSSNAQIPALLQERIKKVVVDPVSKESFILLKQ